MLTFKGFTGINNMEPSHRLSAGDMIEAVDVDIGLTGEITRRLGFLEDAAGCHKNLHHSGRFLLATDGPRLVAIWPDGARHIVHPAIGPERVWFCDLPDGRVTFSNGLVHGVTDGIAGAERSVPTPGSAGHADCAFGELANGQYRYCLTYVRISDMLEGAALESGPISISSGGLRLDGLIALDGHSINVYLSGLDGEGAYLAGTTAGTSFEFAGRNASLVAPCRTLGALPFPVGTITAYWRGRVLTAQGNTLWASRPSAPHLSDWRDFKQMTARITAIQPVRDGVFIGTQEDLVFLAGESWDQLSYMPSGRGPVVLGSGVSAPGQLIKLDNGVGSGPAMVCIAGGEVVAGFSGGRTSSLTEGRYRTPVLEVCAAFREAAEIPQYMAVPQ